MKSRRNQTITSHMSQRVDPDEDGVLDDFPTQPWGTRALIMMLKKRGLVMQEPGHGACWEPAANRGYMARPLTEHFRLVHGSDVFDYGAGYAQRDFLIRYEGDPRFDWIITNPPFRLGEEFALTALDRAEFGCAILVRMPFLETVDRYNNLYKRDRPTFVFQFVERLPLVKGRCIRMKDDGKKLTTATAYCWLVWDKNKRADDTIFDWIPPCRARLERVDTDYLVYGAKDALLDGRAPV